MKKFLGTRIGVIIITVVACLIAFSGVAYGAGVFTRDVPTAFNVLPGNPDLKVYADLECTQPLSSISPGDIEQGGTWGQTIYIRNEGNKDFTAVSFSSGLSSTIGSITPSTNNAPLAKSASRAITLTLDLLPDATIGSVNTNISFACSYN